MSRTCPDRIAVGSLRDRAIETRIVVRWTVPALNGEADYLAVLDPAEQNRHARFRHPEDRLAYAAAHALLRNILSAMFPIAPDAWRFAHTPQGRPLVATAVPGGVPTITLSHTRGLVACAIGFVPDLGLDVERTDRRLAARSIAEAYFTRDEALALGALEGSARTLAFFRLWTLKEAYLKAIGAGLSGDLRVAAFDPRDDSGDGQRRSTSLGLGWTFRHLPVPADFVLSIAMRSDRNGTIPAVDCDSVLPHRPSDEPSRSSTMGSTRL